MEEPYSVVGPETHRSQARPAAAVGTTWWDRHRFDLDQAESRETAWRRTIRLGGLITSENGADYSPRRRQISESEILRRSLVKPGLAGLAAVAVGLAALSRTFNRCVDVRRKLSHVHLAETSHVNPPQDSTSTATCLPGK
jgi:hypothetical protein